jgi:hypothetical protein
MLSSIKNLILIGLGINKMALEALNEFFFHKIQDKSTNKEMAEEFLGTSVKKPTMGKNKNSLAAKSKKVLIK